MIVEYSLNLRHVPLSGHELTDFIFKEFIFFLRKETLRIKRKKRLVNPNDPHGQVLRGLMDPNPEKGTIEITINPAKKANLNRDKETETLIHELCHIVLSRTREWRIESLEKILSRTFTSEQKNFLKSFLPCYEVKK